MNEIRVILVCFFGLLVTLGAQDTGAVPSAPAKQPEVFLQILNGISPDQIDIELDGKVVFPSLKAGQRISAFGLPASRVKMVVIDKKTGNRKSVPLDLQKGYYTLILAGDFKVLGVPDPEKKEELPVRVSVSITKNGATEDGPPVRVRMVNGLTEKPVVIKGPDSKVWTIAPMGVEVASGLTEKLLLEASTEGGARRNLYLAQQPPAKNLSIVFYEAGSDFGFRVMPETTPEGIAADQKAAETTEKAEEGGNAP